MDNSDIQHESNNNALQQNLHTTCRMENISTTLQSLDTVRALHHTVVSLRSALEEAKFEIQRLRSQISTQGDIKEGLNYQKTQQNTKPPVQQKKTYIPKIAQPTKHLRFDLQNNKNKTNKNDFKSTYTKKNKNFNLNPRSIEKIEKPKFHLDLPESTESIISPTSSRDPDSFRKYKHSPKSPQTETQYYESTNELFDTPSTTCRSPQKRFYSVQKYPSSARSDNSIKSTDRTKSPADITIFTTPKYPSKDHNTSDCDKMASKIDVKIKVMSNIKVGNDISDEQQQNQQKQNASNIQDQDEPTSSRSNKEFNFSTEENLTVRQDKDGSYIISQSSKENINLEEDEDISEGDNSVFEKSDKQDKPSEPHEHKEECDDIELIFSSDENRDPIQEEMISLSEYDPWKTTGGTGTPVLVKFSSLPSDQDSPSLPSLDDETNAGQMQTSSTFDEFSTKVNANLTQEKSIDSVESFDYCNPTTKSTSLERDNSEDQRRDSQHTLGRDESFDYFDNKDIGNSGGGGGTDGTRSGTIDRNHRKWTNYNILVETDISKCGIAEETSFELYQRRNTCPNPPAYRPMILRESPFGTRHVPSRLASRYCRRIQQCGNVATSTNTDNSNIGNRILSTQDGKNYSNSGGGISSGPKRSSSAQTEISALPELWKSECQLAGNRYHIGGPCTLPSKFVPIMRKSCQKHQSGISERSSTEARRILLSDINFTSMVPELSRSADHLCQDENRQDEINKQHQQHQHDIQSGYYKGNLLKTPDYALKGMTPSTSMTSPGLSQWTVNENSFGTQTIQTGESWGGKRGDSLDSCRSYSIGSRTSGLDKHHRSRSVPSVRCAVCRQTRPGCGNNGNNSGTGIRNSESMHYTPRVAFQEPSNKVRGSLPDLRHDCLCNRRYNGRTIITIHGESSGSTESLLEEADAFVRKSLDGGGSNFKDDTVINAKRPNLRRMSENDIQKDYIPSKQSLPFLPKTAKCLKPGHLAKVITKTGRVVVGRVRYVGPLVSTKPEPIDENNSSNKTSNNNNNTSAKISTLTTDDLYVGIQLQSKCGDCDGTFEGRKIFECEPLQGLFVPFKKVIMAWTA